MHSPEFGPAKSFRCRLKVFPSGTQTADPGDLSAFVQVLPPEGLETWCCEKVKYSIHSWQKLRGKWEVISSRDCFDFANVGDDRGWHSFVPTAKMMDTLWNGSVCLWATVRNLPYHCVDPTACQLAFRSLDFASPAHFVTFKVAEGAPLRFDARLLQARSEYFAKMLSAELREGRCQVGARRQPKPPSLSKQNLK